MFYVKNCFPGLLCIICGSTTFPETHNVWDFWRRTKLISLFCSFLKKTNFETYEKNCLTVFIWINFSFFKVKFLNWLRRISYFQALIKYLKITGASEASSPRFYQETQCAQWTPVSMPFKCRLNNDPHPFILAHPCKISG